MYKKPQVFIVVDGFKEYVTGISDDEVYVLMQALEDLDESQHELREKPSDRLDKMRGIISEEYFERNLQIGDYHRDY